MLAFLINAKYNTNSMAVRPEIIARVNGQASNGGILRVSGEGARIRQEYAEATTAYTQALGKFIEHSYVSRFGVVVGGSARLPQDSEEYRFVQTLGDTLVAR